MGEGIKLGSSFVQDLETGKTVPYEATQKKVETLDKEPMLRWNVKQTSKGFLYWEFTCRGDSIEELRKLAIACKEELNAICSG